MCIKSVRAKNVNILQLCRTYELSNEVSRPDDDQCVL